VFSSGHLQTIRREAIAVITFKPATNLAKAARFTLTNMQPYYQQYSVAWDEAQIEKMTEDLINFDIFSEGETVGVIRLQFDSEGCYLRDLQVDQNYQNRGIGSEAIAEAMRLAKAQGSQILKLKVFKSSPAVYLYKRQGFSVTSEDERFYYMSRVID
jgi:ribosomal protein S18 acetylase RimI-like enzyme